MRYGVWDINLMRTMEMIKYHYPYSVDIAIEFILYYRSSR